MSIFKIFSSKPKDRSKVPIIAGMLYLILVESSKGFETYHLWSAEEGYLELKVTVKAGAPAYAVREAYQELNARLIMG